MGESKFTFEDDGYALTLSIGAYADEDAGRIIRYDDAELLHDCLTCGRSYHDKADESSGFSVARELIRISDVIAMRDGARLFRERRIDHFGPFPEIGVDGDSWSYFKLELFRDGDVGRCVVTVHQPYGVIETARPTATDEWLQRLENYFAAIAAEYPIRPHDGIHNVIAGAGTDLIASDGNLAKAIDRMPDEVRNRLSHPPQNLGKLV